MMDWFALNSNYFVFCVDNGAHCIVLRFRKASTNSTLLVSQLVST